METAPRRCGGLWWSPTGLAYSAEAAASAAKAGRPWHPPHASSGGTLRSVSSFAQATEDTLIHPRLDRRGFLRSLSLAEEGKIGRQLFRELAVKPEMGTADIVVGVLGAIGVVVLIIVFVFVVKKVLLDK